MHSEASVCLLNFEQNRNENLNNYFSPKKKKKIPFDSNFHTIIRLILNLKFRWKRQKPV